MTIPISKPVKTLGTSLSARDNASTIRPLVNEAKSAGVLLDAAMAAFFAEEGELEQAFTAVADQGVE